jgi:hypothetical protein
MSMTRQAENLHHERTHRIDSDRRLFGLLYALAFVTLFVAYGVARMLPVSGSVWANDQARGEGVMQKARAEANILASFALMH